MDLSQGKFVDDTQETILVKDKVVNGYGSDTPYVAKLRYGLSDEPSTYARQQKEVNNFLSNMNNGDKGYVDKIEDAFLHAVNPLKVVTDFVYGEGVDKAEKEIVGNVATGVATTATSMFYGAEMAGATVPTFIKNVGLGYKYYADILFKSEEELNSPEYMAQWAERQKTEDAVIDAVKEIHKRSGEVAGKIGEAFGVGEENIGSFVGQTFGNVAASLAICYITKNPALTAAVFSLPTYENVLGKSVENGKDLTTSTGVALTAGTITAFLENWGLQNLIENITTKTLKGAVSKTVATETTEELSQQGVEDAALIFWAKDKQFVDENGKIRWSNLLVDLGSAAFGGALGGALGGGIGAGYVQNRINNAIEGLVKSEKYTRGEAETVVNYLLGDDEKARSIYDAEVAAQQIGETKTYEEFILANTELKQARQVMDNISEQMSDPKQVEQITSETMNEALDPANLPNESLDDFAKMVKDSKEQITQQMVKQAEEERKKYDVRDIVQEKGSDKRSIEATKEAVQAFAESEAEEFGVTPRQVVEGKTITLANLADNSGLSLEEKQQILKQSGFSNEETVVAKENGQAPTQEEIDEAYAMMDEEQDKGYIPNVYMQSEKLFDDVKYTKSPFDIKNVINNVTPETDIRVLYDQKKGFWLYSDSETHMHEGFFGTAYLSGLYPEFTNQREAHEYFNEKGDEEFSRLIIKGYSGDYMSIVKEQGDQYRYAYIVPTTENSGAIVFTRFADDFKIAKIGNMVNVTAIVDKFNDNKVTENPDTSLWKEPTVFLQDEGKTRAFADVTDASNILVGMLNSADISYLPHEMTHVFTNLHVQNCIKYGKFNSIEGIMKYFGVTNPMELIQNRDIQERLARMSIQYVNEGEAPTAGLRRYFEMFKRFGKKLVSGWKEKGLIDEDALPDEVRKFFDSLLGKKKQAKIDYERIAEQKADVIQAINRIKAGEAVDISGLPISEVRNLMKVMQTRIPRMPQNLKNALIQAGGIDIDFAKNFDFIQTSGEEKNYRLFKRNGAINSEDALIEFLETNGFIARQEMEDYNDTAEQWERVEQAIENMDNTYREQDMEKVLEREQIEEGIDQANEIIKAVGAEDAFEVIEDIDKLKGRVVAEKEYLDSLERRVKNLDKDYKKLYDQLLKDQAREYAQETKEQVKQAKDEIKDYRNQVIDFIKKQDIELKDKAKLISIVKRANTKASFEKVINDVKERAATLYRKEQVRRLSDLIQKEVSTKRPALKEQKYAYEENKLFSDLRDWNKLNKADAGIRYEAMHNDEEFMGNLTREDEIRLLFLEYKAMGADSSPQLLNTLLNYIEIAKQVGMEARNEQEYKKAMSRDETKEEMIKQVETRKGKPTIYVKFASNLYSSLYTIFGKDIADKYELETVQNKANIHAANHIDKVVKEAMKLYNVKSKGAFLNVLAELGKKAATITTINNNIDTPLSKVGITRELSTLEIMDIYNAIKNEKTRDDYYYWYGKDQIDGLLSKLTNNEMLWADMMMESVDERYAPVNEAFVKTYYTDLPKVDNYWMATSEHKEVKTVFDVQGDFNQQSPSFLKERVKSRVLPKPMNAYSKYTKHIKGTYWVTDMADKQVELLNLLSSLRVKNAIENKLGKDTYNALKRQVEALSFGGLMEDVDYVTGTIDKAINNVVVAKIALGIPVFTGQLSSVGLYAENMGTAKWGIGFAEGLAHPVQTYKFMKEYVGDFLSARFGGGYDETIESVIRASEEGKGKYSLNPRTKYNVVQAITSFVRTGDIGAIIYGGYPRLKQLLETMPREEAVKQFEKETLRGQQASVTASKSAFQQRKGMTRVFTSFRNFQYQAVRKIVDSVYGYMNGEVSAAQAAKTIVLYAIYSPVAYELFRQLGNMIFIGKDAFKDIGEKIFHSMLMQELSIVPVINDIINYALKKYLGQYAKSGITTVGIDDLFRAVDKAYKKNKDVYDYAEIVSPFIEMLTGLPSQRIISTFKKVLEKYD